MAIQAVAVELEAAVHGPDAADPGKADARLPPARLPQLLDVLEERVDARVIAVADALQERRERAPPASLAHRQPGKGGGQAVAVALRAHPALADCRRPPAPSGRRIELGAEDGDLVRRNSAVQQGRVGDESGQAATDDGAAAGRLAAHFTEPASSPWTK